MYAHTLRSDGHLRLWTSVCWQIIGFLLKDVSNLPSPAGHPSHLHSVSSELRRGAFGALTPDLFIIHGLLSSTLVPSAHVESPTARTSQLPSPSFHLQVRGGAKQRTSRGLDGALRSPVSGEAMSEGMVEKRGRERRMRNGQSSEFETKELCERNRT